jgi:hypothetical protein
MPIDAQLFVAQLFVLHRQTGLSQDDALEAAMDDVKFLIPKLQKMTQQPVEDFPKSSSPQDDGI